MGEPVTIHAILLDDYQPAGGSSYVVCFHGSLAECRAQASFDGSSEAWPASDYAEVSSEPTSLTDGTGTVYAGRIAELRVAAAFVADAGARGAYRGPAAIAMLGVALGLVLGRGRKTRRRRR